MRIGRNGILAACVFAGFALPVIGQSSLGTGTPAQRVIQPYTAKFKITIEQTLANGATLTNESTELQIEDSQGRLRTETATPAHGEVAGQTIFHIHDTVARTDVMWATQGKTVSVRKRPPVTQGHTCWSYASDEQERVTATPAQQIVEAAPKAGAQVAAATLRARSQEHSRTNEDLGVQTIQGIEAVGTRMTETTPIGAIGNDAPLVRTTETWRAKSLPLVVRSVADDPRTGKRTRELVELNQSEPDPALFDLPEGYRVVTAEPHPIACPQ